MLYNEYRIVNFVLPVSMKQIAQATGVSVSTVSKALRNDPSISESRCKAIQVAAKKMGYRPNPMVSALMSQMHGRRRLSDPCKIAWIDLWAEGEKEIDVMNTAPVLAGARIRAQELGYGLEVYLAGKDKISPQALRRILVGKGQWGLVIPPVPKSSMIFPMELSGLTGVTIGTSLKQPSMHRVSPNHYQGCALLWMQLRSKGFKRIGLLLTSKMNDRVEGRWLGAYMSCQHEMTEENRLAPLLIEENDLLSIKKWVKSQAPDVIIMAENRLHTATLFKTERRKVIPVAWLMEQKSGLGHLDYLPEQLGRVAIEMVVAQLHRNERGSPSLPQTALIDAVWRPWKFRFC